MRRFWRDERGLSPIVETVIMMLLLIAFFGGFSAYALGAHARSVVIAAADSAGRTASIECGLGESSWQSDAVSAGEQALQDGGLNPVSTAPGQAGYWSVTVSVTGGGCPGGTSVTASVVYDQADLFPFVGPLVGAGPASASVFPVQSSVVFPVE
jgi:Flp pilus assembly protein TadG